ncbi:MAG: hypothetical protein IT449_11610 [Phycisphaerales bacterium]|nr:hypothetical protein [Phycisphaerales bacterium]
MAILALPLAARLPRLLIDFGARPARQATGIRLNPNSAAWWELALLPEIGTGLAQAIKTYREGASGELAIPSADVFSQPADLDAVPGIGPATSSAITAYLAFPGSPR